MKTYTCTCPVCKISHEVEAEFMSSPRTIYSQDGRLGLSCSCGNHSAAELQRAWKQARVPASISG